MADRVWGTEDPRSHVHVSVAVGGQVVVRACYVHVGYGRFSMATAQRMDAAARRALPGARYVESFDCTVQGDASQNPHAAGSGYTLGGRARVYRRPS